VGKRRRRSDAAGHRSRGEQHGEEEQPTAEEHGGKEPVFVLPEAVAHHADEQGKQCLRTATGSELLRWIAVSSEPLARILRTAGMARRTITRLTMSKTETGCRDRGSTRVVKLDRVRSISAHGFSGDHKSFCL